MRFMSAFSAVRSSPSTMIVPDVGRISPFRCCISVDLPLPVWPITPTNAPSGMVMLTSTSASDSNGVPAE